MLDDKNELALTHKGFMDGIEIVDSANTITGLLKNVRIHLGIKVASYHHFAGVGAFDFKNLDQYHSYNMPQEILDFYNNDEKSKNDPGILAVFKTGRFKWISDMEHDPYLMESEHHKLARYASELIGDGLSIPLFGPNNRNGYAFVGFGRGRETFDPIMPFQVQSLIQMLHVRYCLIVEALQTKISLTSRESEVLELICFGKTNLAIAEILNISQHTVGGYVRGIYIKLGVSDRVSAAMRAQSIKVIV